MSVQCKFDNGRGNIARLMGRGVFTVRAVNRGRALSQKQLMEMYASMATEMCSGVEGLVTCLKDMFETLYTGRYNKKVPNIYFPPDGNVQGISFGHNFGLLCISSESIESRGVKGPIGPSKSC